jgi:hypothetical protein
MTPVSDAFTVLESFTGINSTGEGNLALSVSRSPVKPSFTGVNYTSETPPILLFELEIDSTVRMTMTTIPNLSDSEPF